MAWVIGGAVRRMRTGLRYPNPSRQSASERVAPLNEIAGTHLLIVVAILEVALRWKVVVGRGIHLGTLLQRSHAPEPQHRARSSSERQVRVFGTVVDSSPHLAVIAAADVLRGSAIGPQAIRDDRHWTAIPFHRFLRKFQGRLGISHHGHDAFQYLALMIDGMPELVRHTADLDENLAQVQLPVSASTHRFPPFCP